MRAALPRGPWSEPAYICRLRRSCSDTRKPAHGSARHLVEQLIGTTAGIAAGATATASLPCALEQHERRWLPAPLLVLVSTVRVDTHADHGDTTCAGASRYSPCTRPRAGEYASNATTQAGQSHDSPHGPRRCGGLTPVLFFRLPFSLVLDESRLSSSPLPACRSRRPGLAPPRHH